MVSSRIGKVLLSRPVRVLCEFRNTDSTILLKKIDSAFNGGSEQSHSSVRELGK